MKKVLSGTMLAMLLASLFGFGLNFVQFPHVAGEFSTDEHTLALWHFNEGQGQNVYDASSHSNDGTLGPTVNVEDRDPSWTTGFTGKTGDYALSFDEWWDYVYVPDNPDDSLDLLGGDQFTIEFWTYVRQISRSDRGSGIHWNAFINKWQAGTIGGYEMAQCLHVPPPPLFDAWFYNSTGVPLHAGCDPTPTYEWVHVMFTYDGQYSRIYFDGVLQNETDVGHEYVAGNDLPLTIGKNLESDYPWNDAADCIIDEARISSIVRGQATTLEVVNAEDGTNNFTFYTNTTVYGDTFVVNVTVKDVTDLWSWNYKLRWNPALLQVVNVSLPADHVFAYPINVLNYTMTQGGPTVDNVGGTVHHNLTYIMGSTFWVFNGTGTLAQITFEIIKSPDYATPQLSTNLTLSPPLETWLKDWNGDYISFGAVNGYYEFNLPLPYLEVRPSLVEGQEIGITFAVEIWVRNLDAAWVVVGIQFALPYNATLVDFAGWTDGTFMESYANGGESVFTAAKGDIVDFANPGFKAVVGCEYIAPDPITSDWVDPFPNGDGLLMTLHFNPIYETVYPDLAEMPLEIRNVDLSTILYFEAAIFLTKYSDEISYAKSVQGLYRAPQVYADIAVTDVTTSKSGCAPMPTVCQGFSASVNVTVVNWGEDPKTFNVTAYANATIIGTEVVSDVGPGEQITLTFNWNTTGWDRGNYTISAYAWVIPGEVNPDDNTFEDGIMKVTIVGDINGDGKVDMRDIGMQARAFDATPESPNWDPNADINEDGTINMRDIGIVARHFGEQE